MLVPSPLSWPAKAGRDRKLGKQVNIQGPCYKSAVVAGRVAYTMDSKKTRGKPTDGATRFS
jgi:hypothetical protein